MSRKIKSAVTTVLDIESVFNSFWNPINRPHLGSFNFFPRLIIKHRLTHFFLLLLVLLHPQLMQAHHSFSVRFDMTKFMEIDGVIEKATWRNPHVLFTLKVDNNGIEEQWLIEANAFSTIKRFGLSSDMVNVGDRVKIGGYPPRLPIQEMFATNILRPNGQEMIMDANVRSRWSDKIVGSEEFWQAEKGDGSAPGLGIFRTWSFTFKKPFLFREITDPTFSMDNYPLTESARNKLAALNADTDLPTENCAAKGMPTIMEQPYPMEIKQGDDGKIIIKIEEYDTVRTVYMNEKRPSNGQAKSLLGYSVGHWDGNTLVVDTYNTSWRHFNSMGIPLSEEVQINERFTPTPDGSRLDYVLTIIDTITFTEPVILDHHYWLYLPEMAVQPFNCISDE